MITVNRKLWGVLPYTTVFFPDARELAETAARLGPLHFARFFWMTDQPVVDGRLVRHEPTATVCVDLKNPPETLWSAVAKNARNEIRSVERLGDRVSIARDGPDTRRDFLRIYNRFARVKEGVSEIDDTSLKRYANHVAFFAAYLDQQPMCAHAFLQDRSLGRVRLLYSASRRLSDPQTARLCGNLNRLLHWREICAYRGEGYAIYDLGGIREDSSDGIARFKRSFGGGLVKENTFVYAGSRAIAAAARVLLKKQRRAASTAESAHPTSPEESRRQSYQPSETALGS